MDVWGTEYASMKSAAKYPVCTWFKSLGLNTDHSSHSNLFPNMQQVKNNILAPNNTNLLTRTCLCLSFSDFSSETFRCAICCSNSDIVSVDYNTIKGWIFPRKTEVTGRRTCLGKNQQISDWVINFDVTPAASTGLPVTLNIKFLFLLWIRSKSVDE